MAERIGLIAGNGRLPFHFTAAAKARGLEVVAIAHVGETDPALASEAAVLRWVRVGQLGKIARELRALGVERAAMAGGIGRVRALRHARPDLGALFALSRLRHFRDDALLRAAAGYLEQHGVRIVSATSVLPELLAQEGHLGGPSLDGTLERDVALGAEVASLLGEADVGQTVVVKGGHVLALEAVEGTDEAIRRGGALGGQGAVVVKLCKLGQDERFDLPAVGPTTLEVMAQVGARALAVEAGRTILLEPQALLRRAGELGISVVGIHAPRRARG